MPEPIIVMAFLRHNERLRSTCLGCSHILHEQGMLRIAFERDAEISNAPAGAYSVVIYEIAPGFTIGECREAVSARHVGASWGE